MIKMSNKALRTALLKGVNEYATYAHESSWARGAFDAYAQAFSEASYAFIREATFFAARTCVETWCECVFDIYDLNKRPSDYLRGFHYAAVEIGNMFED